MRKTEVYQIRLDSQEKKHAFAVFKQLGITPAQAVRLFFKQVVLTKSIPFSYAISCASFALITPSCSPSAETTRISLSRICSLICKSFLLIVNPSLKHKQKNGCKTHPHNTPIPKVSVYLPQSLRRTVRTDCSACFLF